MSTPGISPAQLKRCRKMYITDISEDNPRWKLEVFNPEETRLMNKLYARTLQDLSRMQRALEVKFRVPKENIFIVTKDGTTSPLVAPPKEEVIEEIVSQEEVLEDVVLEEAPKESYKVYSILPVTPERKVYSILPVREAEYLAPTTVEEETPSRKRKRRKTRKTK